MNTQKYHSTHKGFTIVELLIVIVVIGILAGISTVVYGNISGRAKDAKLGVTASSVERLINIKKAETGTLMPSASSTNAEDIKKEYRLNSLGDDIVVKYFSGDSCVEAKSDTCSWGGVYDEAADVWRADPQLKDKVTVEIHEYDESRNTSWNFCHSGIKIIYEKNTAGPGDEGRVEREIVGSGRDVGCFGLV